MPVSLVSHLTGSSSNPIGCIAHMDFTSLLCIFHLSFYCPANIIIASVPAVLTEAGILVCVSVSAKKTESY